MSSGVDRSEAERAIGAIPVRGASALSHLQLLVNLIVTTLQLSLVVMSVRRIVTRSPTLRRRFSSARVYRADFTHAVSTHRLALYTRRYGTIAASPGKT
jgi:hypothetical protein